METARLILDYVAVLVWPALILAALLLYKKPLSALIERMKRAELPGGFAFDLGDEIRAAEELSIDVAASAKARHERVARGPSIPLTEANARMIQLGLSPSPSGLDFGYYLKLAEEDPNIALAGLRMEIEVLTRNLAIGFEVPLPESPGAGRLLSALHAHDAIDSEQFLLAQKVLRVCNAAVHGTRVSEEQANAVIDIATVLRQQYVAWLSWGFDDGWAPSQE